jgi:hypothetical protein
MPGWRVEPTAEEDDSLSAYSEWTFVLNKYYACSYLNTEYFRYYLFYLGNNISVLFSISFIQYFS